jgi:RND family efflux transporter MFP subunit
MTVFFPAAAWRGLAAPTLALFLASLSAPPTWAQPAGARAPARAALTVTLTQPQRAELPLRVPANGTVHAWQEAIIGAEGGPWRLAEVRAGIGDAVKRGQVLAVFAAELVEADVALARAGVAEAEAVLAEMAAKAQRARELQPTGVLSTEQVQQALTAERTAQARLQAQRAALQLQQLREKQLQVLAPDDGIVSARAATVGAVVPPGQELFRLIRQGRLEWRAEVAAADLAQLRAGQSVRVQAAGVAAPVTGRLRMVAPTVDASSRNGLVYVDLPAAPGLRAGTFARGEFETGASSALTLPQSAVVMREGFAYVFRMGPEQRVAQTKVAVGRRVGERVEVLSGLDAAARVVASGAGFLADGDTVKVVDK